MFIYYSDSSGEIAKQRSLAHELAEMQPDAYYPLDTAVAALMGLKPDRVLEDYFTDGGLVRTRGGQDFVSLAGIQSAVRDLKIIIPDNGSLVVQLNRIQSLEDQL